MKPFPKMQVPSMEPIKKVEPSKIVEAPKNVSGNMGLKWVDGKLIPDMPTNVAPPNTGPTWDQLKLKNV